MNEYRSHVTDVAVPGMMPSEGPTGYVLPLSATAWSVRDVGWTSTSVKFQPMVMIFPCAILKYEVAVWGGCVIVRLPAGAVWGILDELEDGGAPEELD